MRLATDSGYVSVRASHPLSGLDTPSRFHNGDAFIALADAPGGGVSTATLANVYRCNPWVYAANQAISRGVSRLILKVWKYDEKGARERVRSDLPGSLGRPSIGQKLDSLVRIPEPGVGRQEWLRKIQLDRGVYGNALGVKARNSATDVPEALFHVPWSRVTVERGDDLSILYYEVASGGGLYGNSGDKKKFSPNDVVHFGRGTDLDSPIGLSPLSSLKATIALHDALWRHAVAYFKNSARPSGMVKLDKAASEKVIESVRSQIEALYTAPEQAGRVLVTSGEWSSMTESPEHSQIVELARLSREEIAAAYGIPQPMMGILDRAILNNTKELRNYFTRDVVGVEASALEDDLMAQLVYATPSWSGYFVEFDLMEALRPDPEALGDLAEKTRHVITPNEFRDRFLGANPLDVEGADTVWMPSGQTGLGMEPPPEPETPAPKDDETGDEPTGDEEPPADD